jgi:hypothetical protein
MSDYFDRVERQLVTRVEASTRRSWRAGDRIGLLLPLAGALVVFAVAAVFLTAGPGRRSSSSPSASGSTVVFTASPAARHTALEPAIRESVLILRRRLAAVSQRLRVAQVGDQVVVAGSSSATIRRVVELAAPGRLTFFDWEATVLTPNGRPVAGQLTAGNAGALTISQGVAAGPPGVPQAGGLSLYEAVALAAHQPAMRESSRLSRPYSQYYLFGRASGSRACTDAARAAGTAPSSGAHCLLGGPSTTLAALRSSLPPRVGLSDGSLRVVPPGTVVLEASSPHGLDPLALSDPAARFFVLRDKPALGPLAISNPRPSTDQSGSPDVTFSFTSRGGREFKRVTTRISRRGASASTAGMTLNQHFAIALDGRLLTVPSIDYRTYPEGIPGAGGADITAGLTTRGARDLALLLRDGPLPATLSPEGPGPGSRAREAARR